MSTAKTVGSITIKQYITLALKHAEYIQNEDGTWTVKIPILPGLITFGETKKEAMEMAEDAVPELPAPFRSGKGLSVPGMEEVGESRSVRFAHSHFPPLLHLLPGPYPKTSPRFSPPGSRSKGGRIFYPS